jgi:hypothetical protein
MRQIYKPDGKVIVDNEGFMQVVGWDENFKDFQRWYKKKQIEEL